MEKVDLQEPPIARANSHIHNEVKLLVKRRIAARRRALRPGVLQQCLVLRQVPEVPALVHGTVVVEANVQDLVHPAVDIKVDVVLGPLNAVRVEALRQVTTSDLLSPRGAPVRVGLGGGACVLVSIVSLASDTWVWFVLPQWRVP